MVQLVERKVRSRAKQLYETRGQTEGQAYRIGFRLNQKCLKIVFLLRLYRRMRSGNQDNAKIAAGQEPAPQDSTACESNV